MVSSEVGRLGSTPSSMRGQGSPLERLCAGVPRPARAKPPHAKIIAMASTAPPTVPSNPAELVGGTPLVQLARAAASCGAELLAKLEAYNPAGSVKDRIGVAMIEAAEREGRIEPGRTTIVEATSGNTGHRARLRLRGEGLRARPDPPAGHEPRARGPAAPLRRACRDHRVARRHGRGRRGGRGDRPAARRLLHPGPVLEPGEPRDPPPHDRRGDLARHRRRGGRARGRGRHRRDDHRCRRGAEGAQPGPARGGRRAACVAGPLRRHAPVRTRSRASAPASCRRC